MLIKMFVFKVLQNLFLNLYKNNSLQISLFFISIVDTVYKSLVLLLAL